MDKMRYALEKLANKETVIHGHAWRLGDYFEEAFAELEAALTPSHWVPCSERLPTEADYDVNGNIWICCPRLVDAQTGKVLVEQSGVLPGHMEPDSLWKPTGLVRPEPPEVEG